MEKIFLFQMYSKRFYTITYIKLGYKSHGIQFFFLANSYLTICRSLPLPFSNTQKKLDTGKWPCDLKGGGGFRYIRNWDRDGFYFWKHTILRLIPKLQTFYLNLFKSNRNQIVLTIFRLISIQMDVRLDPNQSVHGK